jgi:hypothetical protein
VILAHKGHPDPLLMPETTLRRAELTFSPSQFLITVAGTLHPLSPNLPSCKWGQAVFLILMQRVYVVAGQVVEMFLKN